MAMANVAYRLAMEGQKVFLVDFDLEAPGLTLMPEFLPVEGKGPACPGGLLAFLKAGLDQKPMPKVADLAYVPRIAGEPKMRGKLHVLPAADLAGRPGSYDISGLRLDLLYADQQRAVVIDDLRMQIQDDFRPDYVLVDSRTGLTEIGGICTTHLADFVVVFFGLNSQNIDGTGLVLERLSRAGVGRKKGVLLVASPVPTGEECLKEERLGAARARFARAMGRDEGHAPQLLTVPYHPQLALSEASFVARHPSSPLAHAYRLVADKLRGANKEDMGFVLEGIWGRMRSDPRAAKEQLDRLLSAPSAPARAFGMRAVLLVLAAKKEDAERDFRRALDIDPEESEVLRNYAAFLVYHKRCAEAQTFLDKGLTANQDNPAALSDLLLLRARARREAGDLGGAIEDLSTVAEMAKAPAEQKAEARVNRGVAYGKKGETDREIAEYTAVIDDPEAPAEQKAEARFNRGVAYGKKGETDREIADYTAVIDDPEAPAEQKAKARVNRGTTYGEKGETDREIAEYTAVIDDPEAPAEQKASARVNRGVAYGKKGETDKAIAEFTAVIDDPEAPAEQKAQARVNRGVAYGKNGETEKEIADYTTVIDDPEAPAEQKASALANRGWAAYQSGAVDAMVKDSRAALQVGPQVRFARFNLGFGLLLLGQSQEALEEYKRAAAECKKAEAVRSEGIVDLEEAMRVRGAIAGADKILNMLRDRVKQLESATNM